MRAWVNCAKMHVPRTVSEARSDMDRGCGEWTISLTSNSRIIEVLNTNSFPYQLFGAEKLGIALSTLLYIWKIPLKNSIEKIASLGYEGIEIRAGEPDASAKRLKANDRKALKKIIESNGLQVYSLTPDWGDLNLASSNPVMREESVRQVKEAIELAADFGAEFFTILPGRRHAIASLETCRDWSLDSLAECVSLAEKLGVTLCLEGAPGQVVAKEEDLVQVVRKINSRSLRLAADTSHAYVLGDPSTYFRKIGDYIGIVHIADNDGTPNVHLPPGLGKVDFASVLEVLRGIGYRGHYLLEISYPENPDWAAEQSKIFMDKLISDTSSRDHQAK